MPIPVKSAQATTEKWQRRVAASAADYKAGVESPRRDWAANTAAANETYVTAVTQAANEGRFAAGVQKAGNAKWQKGAAGKGVQRWAPGVSAAGGDYARGVAPYLSAIANVDLPPRGPAGSEQNKARMTAIFDAVHAEKLRQLAAA